MAYAPSDGANLYYEEAGTGYPIIFVHEFAGDWRSWEPQMRYFSRRYRCITYSARGYLPSDVPEIAQAYGQTQATDDVAAVLRHLDIPRAHVIGLSMGGFATLHFGRRYPEMARSLVAAGAGYGAPPGDHEIFKAACRETAAKIENLGMEKFVAEYCDVPARRVFARKNPRGYAEFLAQFAGHSELGSAMHMRNVQGGRPSLWDFFEEWAGLAMPLLVVNGDTDLQCLETGGFLRATVPDAQHWVLPDTGHTINLEEPDLFNQGIERFLAAAEARSPA